MSSLDIGLVAIGRNEGERLHRCLKSVAEISARLYVDSGSDDGSVEWVRAQGIDVVALAIPPKFTAARARNAGIERLRQRYPSLVYVQMIDGDCELSAGWLTVARKALEDDPALAGVFGRLRERFAGHSVYNAMCDEEWDVPIGEAEAFGGIVLLRIDALDTVGGYDPGLIAGEEPELARRMRDRGWKIRRIDCEMALHDAAITHFSQWWGRTRRSGHAYAELAHRYPRSPAPNWLRSCISIAIWGGAVPLGAVIAAAIAMLASAYGAVVTVVLVMLWTWKVRQIAKGKRQRGHSAHYAWTAAAYLMVGKVAQLSGIVTYLRDRALTRDSQIIDYLRPISK